MSRLDDIDAIRAEFPQLARRIHGKSLVYFDNANTAQKPRAVIDAVSGYYTEHNANVARAVHTLGEEATSLYEAARDKLAGFVGARSREDVVFTRGTTESVNLVAYSFLRPNLQPGDEILVSRMEHHANIVPWQLVAAETGAKVVPAPITEAGELDVEGMIALMNARTRLVGLTHVSNALGTINPVKRIIDAANARGIPTLIDGSQAVPHFKVDVAALDCDFYVLTGHKLFAPTGTGALIAKRVHLDAMPPFMGGGEMIRKVSFEGTTFSDPPHKFEAGTPNIAGFIGLGAAIDWLNAVGMDAIARREAILRDRMLDALRGVDGLRLIGAARERAAVFSFVVEGAHAHDIATLLDHEGVAVRSGHHCTHPTMQFFGLPATVRASLSFYNTEAEIAAFVAALAKVRRMLA
ncbi:MAG TPA: cysteine desulfurase [Patescibacteria group bacterium]|nr:cysteine desulfurase [Patescibacteria group bacterium]